MSGTNDSECALAKVAYEKAFLKWYENVFLPSKGGTREMCCKEEFDVYQKCTQSWMETKGVQSKLRKWEQRQPVEDEGDGR